MTVYLPFCKLYNTSWKTSKLACLWDPFRNPLNLVPRTTQPLTPTLVATLPVALYVITVSFHQICSQQNIRRHQEILICLKIYFLNIIIILLKTMPQLTKNTWLNNNVRHLLLTWLISSPSISIVGVNEAKAFPWLLLKYMYSWSRLLDDQHSETIAILYLWYFY